MSKEKFDDECRGCKPAMMDLKTNQIIPDDHPHMVILLDLWSEQSKETKQAWHRVTCQNSVDINDRKLAGAFMDQFRAKAAHLQKGDKS